MNSLRKYAFTVLRRYDQRILHRTFTSKMEKQSANLGLGLGDVNKVHNQNRVVTRSYSKQLEGNDANKSFPVLHNESKKEFYIKMSDGEKGTSNKAILTYEWEGPKMVDLQHTYVSDAFRGKGVAKLLAEEAFEHFTSEGATMRLSCSYLQKYASDHKNSKYTSHICWD